MTPEDLWRRYPQLFHVAFAAGRDGILRNGLWSAEELARRLGWPQQRREKWLTRRRPEVGGFEDKQLGRVTFRDHKAIPTTIATTRNQGGCSSHVSARVAAPIANASR